MEEMTQAYPLHWPFGKPRTRSPQKSRFDTSFTHARDGLINELELLGAKNEILSSNLPLRLDGIPYANRPAPDDRGVAVYFTYKGKQMCFACDKWDSVGDNIQAVFKTIQALRGIARWGTGDMMESAFSGFLALPPPQGKDWWDVLGVGKNASQDEITKAYKEAAKRAHDEITKAYKEAAKRAHPDVGGSEDEMAALNVAYKAAIARGDYEGAKK